jgi:hypothetical protein
MKRRREREIDIPFDLIEDINAKQSHTPTTSAIKAAIGHLVEKETFRKRLNATFAGSAPADNNFNQKTMRWWSWLSNIPSRVPLQDLGFSGILL